MHLLPDVPMTSPLVLRGISTVRHVRQALFSLGVTQPGVCANRYGQRLTFHPSHFVKLATADEALLCKSIKELEVHSQVCPRPWKRCESPATLGCNSCVCKQDRCRHLQARFAGAGKGHLQHCWLYMLLHARYGKCS